MSENNDFKKVKPMGHLTAGKVASIRIEKVLRLHGQEYKVIDFKDAVIANEPVLWVFTALGDKEQVFLIVLKNNAICRAGVEEAGTFQPAPGELETEEEPESKAVLPGEEYQKSQGKNFNADLSPKDIAKRIRADVKELKKRGRLPKGLKLSIRSGRSGYVGKIDISIVAAPFGLVNRAAVKLEVEEGPDAFLKLPLEHEARQRFSARARVIIRKLNQLVESYQRKETNQHTSYCHTNFFHNVDVSYESRYAEWDRIKEELQADASCAC